ncbi:16S rRNA processing protein RimM [Fontimonas thermophila]|uniref:Ribosome maturation factor RimM n=1 Tax=Fontimonas thermophila TaxID=1076937 RepID=A0A1I2HRA5_9GAMM|nr:ribosome maturation factor RimM [Fontimonas thermophila]SFF31933.1 16S rRNA processing protein RimM [Fontimonas thermophila]
MAGRRLTLGRVAGVYGVRGWLRIDSQTRPPTKILDYPRWWLRHNGQDVEVRKIQGHAHGRGVVAQIEDAAGRVIDDRDAASRLIGAEIAVDREDLPRLPKGQYYWVDLIGLTVVNPSGTLLGTVQDMTSNGVQDVLVVVDEAGVERLIPFVRRHIVKRVELAAGRIICDWELDY